MKLLEILFEKLELVNWNLYCELVADAYDKAPENDPEAEKSYSCLRSTVDRFFKMIESKVDVEFVDGDPYTSAEQMRKEIEETKVMKVMKDFSIHPFFSEEENWKFRAVHDWYSHVITKQPFTQKGELSTYNTHIKMFPPECWPALFTEIIGQACYQSVRGSFPVQKVAILKGFDYKHIGGVEGYLIKDKKLIKK